MGGASGGVYQWVWPGMGSQYEVQVLSIQDDKELLSEKRNKNDL